MLAGLCAAVAAAGRLRDARARRRRCRRPCPTRRRSQRPSRPSRNVQQWLQRASAMVVRGPRGHQQCGQGRQRPDRLAAGRAGYVVSLSAPGDPAELAADRRHAFRGRHGWKGWKAARAKARTPRPCCWKPPAGTFRSMRWPPGCAACRRRASRGRPVLFDRRAPAALEQAGWRIDYTDGPMPQDGQPPLPRRIEARRDQATVRLIVDRWDFTAP